MHGKTKYIILDKFHKTQYLKIKQFLRKSEIKNTIIIR